MTPEKAFTLEMKDFLTKFSDIVDRIIPTRIDEALFKTSHRILDDANNIAPQTPFKLSGLRGSRFVDTPRDESGGVSCSFGFNIVYAARLHEGEKDWKWTKTKVPRPGPKYIESKLIRFKKKYAEQLAKYIKEG